MKKGFIYIGILLAGLGFTACDDFLMEDSPDLLIPENVEDYIPLLYGEGYPRSFESEASWIALMTDDVEMGPLDGNADSGYDTADEFDSMSGGDGEQAYTWDIDIEERLTDYNWDRRYEDILGCNTIIDALPTMYCPEQDSAKYYALASQAYALRAYHYFVLVNLYAKPWSEENLDELGVIIRTTPQIETTMRERSTIGEVYELINSDLDTARYYMQFAEISANKHLLSPAAIRLLTTRVALFQEKWDEVLEVGEEFLTENSFIYDLNSVSEDQMGDDGEEFFSMMNLENNDEIVFTFGSTGKYEYLSSSSLYGLGFRVSYSDESSLLQAYGDDDLRKLAWFKQNEYDEGFPPFIEPSTTYNQFYPIKYGYYSGGAYHENWRTVEVVLNMAEAYARSANGVSQDAIDMLNQLRRNRIKNYQDLTVADFTSQQDLVEFVWDERRRELCFEEAMRFWDLRRQGMPQLIHKFYNNSTTYETYVLPEGSPNYVLAIPRSETTNNTVITSNVREVINPQ